MAEIEFDEDWGAMVERRIRSTMEMLEEQAQRMNDGDEIEDEIDTPSGYPYCGCETCYYRELLYLSMSMALEGARDDKIRLVGDADEA